MQTINADSKLTIDLSVIADNYKLLCKKFTGSKVASVVKANAYGLGIEKVAPRLAEVGCKSFFVANLDEAVQLRGVLPESEIFVFHGVCLGQEKVFCEYNLIPCIASSEQFKIWSLYANKLGKKLPAILHIDTGMNRLGISFSCLERFVSDNDISCLDVRYVMSHLACADDEKSKKNIEQLNKIRIVAKILPNIPISFVNSSGVFLGENYHFDLARPGVALYGGSPNPAIKNPMRNVISLTSKIIQIRELVKDEDVGYGATANLKKGSKIATLPVGYADGYVRSLGNKGFCYFGDEKLPVVGRVSMDLITVDVTSILDNEIKVGDEIEIIGNNATIDDIATCAGTIGYEVLTSLGRRYNRVYTG